MYVTKANRVRIPKTLPMFVMLVAFVSSDTAGLA